MSPRQQLPVGHYLAEAAEQTKLERRQRAEHMNPKPEPAAPRPIPTVKVTRTSPARGESGRSLADSRTAPGGGTKATEAGNSSSRDLPASVPDNPLMWVRPPRFRTIEAPPGSLVLNAHEAEVVQRLVARELEKLEP
jgi:hypothetical protein